MPVRVKSIGRGNYRVSTPKGVKAHSTSKEKAMHLKRLLNAVEHSNWRPAKGFGVK